MTQYEIELRDKAALAALQGLCAHTGAYGRPAGVVAKRAHELAEAFIAERKNREQVDDVLS